MRLMPLDVAEAVAEACWDDAVILDGLREGGAVVAAVDGVPRPAPAGFLLLGVDMLSGRWKGEYERVGARQYT